jgi:hypothetical protein
MPKSFQVSSLRSAVCPTRGGSRTGTTITTLAERPPLSAEQLPRGATEATLFAHGFWREMLAGPVLAGLATVTTAFIRAGGSGSLPDHGHRTKRRSKVDRVLQSLSVRVEHVNLVMLYQQANTFGPSSAKWPIVCPSSQRYFLIIEPPSGVPKARELNGGLGCPRRAKHS